MAIRLQNSDSMTTRELLAAVLLYVKQEKRVSFHCDAGMGDIVAQRLRSMLTRWRRSLEREGKPIARFTLHHEVYPETVDGKRCDCLVFWRTKFDSHFTLELLDDLVGTGAK